MNKTILFGMFLCISTYLFSADNIISVTNVMGECALMHITPEQAKQQALLAAKTEALRRAGVEENIAVTTTLQTAEQQGSVWDVFHSFSAIEVRGGIIDYTITDEQLTEKSETPVYKVVINATVKKYVGRPDPTFSFLLSGILKNGYRNNENITFSIKPAQNGYLKIFMFENEQNATLVFPNDYEPNRQFVGGQSVAFPTNQIIEYTATKQSQATPEHNYLVFVYTKTDMPFMREVNYKNVLNWIYSIEPDLRVVEFVDVPIY